MRGLLVTIALLLVGTTRLVGAQDLSCVNLLDAMPESWRPSTEMQRRLSDPPWSAAEAERAQFALKTGVEEMLALYASRPQALAVLSDDGVESLIDVTYSGGTGSSAVDAVARKGAHRNLERLVTPYLGRDLRSARCEEFQTLLPLASYAHRFFSEDDARTARVVALANSALRKCPSFAIAVGNSYRAMLANERLVTEDVFDLVTWSIQLIEAELVPGLNLPQEAHEFSPTLWRYLQTYPMPDAGTYKDGAWNRAFRETGYLATHIAFIPTGYHRHPIYIEDFPRVYRFFRENFYPLLKMGELDLVAEFVDALRQYGCTEETDRQVRDGTRYMLKVFAENGDRWMNYREPGEADEDLDAYDLIHKAWSATIGLRRRTPEPPEPGTYGGVVRRWLRNASDR